MAGFGGFPLAGLDLYEDLEVDNSKTFWTAHKHIYEQAVRDPMLALTAELESDFGTAKIFRPYRDVRFAKDKSPYKTHQGAVAGTAPGVGWYVQIGAAGLFVSGGFYRGSAEQVAQFRRAVDDDVRGPELESILRPIVSAGFVLGGETLKTRPKGYDADHPRIALLRHKSITCSRAFGAPDWLSTPQTADQVRAAWATLRPLVEWSTAVVGPAGA